MAPKFPEYIRDCHLFSRLKYSSVVPPNLKWAPDCLERTPERIELRLHGYHQTETLSAEPAGTLAVCLKITAGSTLGILEDG